MFECLRACARGLFTGHLCHSVHVETFTVEVALIEVQLHSCLSPLIVKQNVLFCLTLLNMCVNS